MLKHIVIYLLYITLCFKLFEEKKKKMKFSIVQTFYGNPLGLSPA